MEQILDDLKNSVQEIAGDRLIKMVLYGDAIGQEHGPGLFKINEIQGRSRLQSRCDVYKRGKVYQGVKKMRKDEVVVERTFQMI